MPVVSPYSSSARRGFTVVELVIVIIVIGILAAVVTLSYSNARTRAKDTERESDILVIKHALDKWANENGTYPLQGPLYGGMDTDFPVTDVGIPRDALINPDAPDGTTNSVSEDAYGSALTSMNYGYRAFDSTGAACWSYGTVCEGYKLFYYKQATNEVMSVAGGICTTEIEGSVCNASFDD